MIKLNNFHLLYTRYFMNLHFEKLNKCCDKFGFCVEMGYKNRIYITGIVK